MSFKCNAAHRQFLLYAERGGGLTWNSQHGGYRYTLESVAGRHFYIEKPDEWWVGALGCRHKAGDRISNSQSSWLSDQMNGLRKEDLPRLAAVAMSYGDYRDINSRSGLGLWWKTYMRWRKALRKLYQTTQAQKFHKWLPVQKNKARRYDKLQVFTRKDEFDDLMNIKLPNDPEDHGENVIEIRRDLRRNT